MAHRIHYLLVGNGDGHIRPPFHGVTQIEPRRGCQIGSDRPEGRSTVGTWGRGRGLTLEALLPASLRDSADGVNGVLLSPRG
jgi:hypothetical protein